MSHLDRLAHQTNADWLGLVIGNSRLHWAWFRGAKLYHIWDMPHLAAPTDLTGLTVLEALAAIAPEGLPPGLAGLAAHHPPLHLPLWVVSVVAQQLAPWQSYPAVHCLAMAQVPIPGLYPTLGIDRAVALWGAMQQWGTPVLVIDGGTALTFTGAGAAGRLEGGAILPGLGLQGRSLHQFTATLPEVAFRPGADHLPPRWAATTPDAIRSGILYTMTAGIISFIEAWRQRFPASPVILTGGDGALLAETLQAIAPQPIANVEVDPHLAFHGMAAMRQRIMDEAPSFECGQNGT